MQVLIFYCNILSYVVIIIKRKTSSVTVRLPIDLIEWIDKQIDGVNNRNRSHIIEKAIKEYQNRSKLK
jgi:metal-responsive CopG/Arc/MetJ family transcriptional regulator